MKPQHAILLAALGALVISGCGNIGSGLASGKRVVGRGSGQSYGNFGMLSFGLPADFAATYSCPTGLSSNVGPVSSADANDDNSFAACAHKSDAFEAALVGDGTQQTVCVFPAEEINGVRYLKLDGTGKPISLCPTFRPMTGGGSNSGSLVSVRVRFDWTNFNAFYVTKSQDKARMEQCIQYSAYYPSAEQMCPLRSYGRFRESRDAVSEQLQRQSAPPPNSSTGR